MVGVSAEFANLNAFVRSEQRFSFSIQQVKTGISGLVVAVIPLALPSNRFIRLPTVDWPYLLIQPVKWIGIAVFCGSHKTKSCMTDFRSVSWNEESFGSVEIGGIIAVAVA
jgi:hypothetical protein